MLNPELERPLGAFRVAGGPTQSNSSPDAAPLSTAGSNRPSSVTDYPPKPKSWASGRNGAGECGKCGAWWQGFDTCHCSTCHATFTSITAFDKHRAGGHAHGTRHCLDPATVIHGPKSQHAGESMLVDAGRDYPCWGFAGSDVQWWGGDAA